MSDGICALCAESRDPQRGPLPPQNMRITVIAHPNSKRPRIETDLLGIHHVYVSEPPIEGKANAAIIEALARSFHIKKSVIHLLSGAISRHKIFEVELSH